MAYISNIRLFCFLFVLNITSLGTSFNPGTLFYPRFPSRGCWFGSRTRAIGSSWHPNLGEPFGVMNCIICRCIKLGSEAIGNHSKLLTKVICQDVRKRCPIITCKDAVVPRRKCCKVCPDELKAWAEEDVELIETTNSSLPSKIELAEKSFHDETRIEDNDDKMKRFFALLTNHHNGGSVYRADFNLRKENLQFTLQYTKRPPNIVELLDRDYSLLYSHKSSPSPKPGHLIICGIWKKLSKTTTAKLEKKVLYFRAIEFSANGNKTSLGRITRHRALNRETFSALLSSKTQNSSSGAIAMLSLGKFRFNRLHLAVVYWNNFQAKENLTIELFLKNSDMKTLKFYKKVAAVKHEDDLALVWQASSEVLHGLGAAVLYLEIRITYGSEHQSYTGKISSKISCDLLQAVLSGRNCLQQAHTGAAGSATLQLHSDNSLSYVIQLVGLSSEIRSLFLKAEYRRRTRLIANITANYAIGKAEGKIEKLSGKEIHLLLSKRVRITVETDESDSGELAGLITPLQYGGFNDRYMNLSIPMAGFFAEPPVFTGAAGHAWLSLNKKCQLHYEIIVSGFSKSEESTIFAELQEFIKVPNESLPEKLQLNEFYDMKANGVVNELSSQMYQLLDRGFVFLQISTKQYPDGEIKGFVHLPNKCSNRLGAEKVFSNAETKLTDGSFNFPYVASHGRQFSPASCYFEGKWREESEQWAPDYDRRCTICFCERSHAICNPVYCSPLSCARPIMEEDKCCPVCEDFDGIAVKSIAIGIDSLFSSSTDRTYGCLHEGTMHTFGSWWHPASPQFGVIACANCSCGTNGEIACARVSCPRTPCDRPYKKTPTDCCDSCPAESSIKTLFRSKNKNFQDDSGARMCKFGSTVRTPGETWTLKISNAKRMNCFKCSCSVYGTKTTCERKCPRIRHDCSSVKRLTGQCCPWRCVASG